MLRACNHTNESISRCRCPRASPDAQALCGLQQTWQQTSWGLAALRSRSNGSAEQLPHVSALKNPVVPGSSLHLHPQPEEGSILGDTQTADLLCVELLGSDAISTLAQVSPIPPGCRAAQTAPCTAARHPLSRHRCRVQNPRVPLAGRSGASWAAAQMRQQPWRCAPGAPHQPPSRRARARPGWPEEAPVQQGQVMREAGQVTASCPAQAGHASEPVSNGVHMCTPTPIGGQMPAITQQRAADVP